MFKLYHLPGSALLPQQAITQHSETRHAQKQYLIHGIPFPPQPMLLLRQILAVELKQMDETSKQQLYEQHQVLLSLVFGGANSVEASREFDKSLYRPLTARLESNLTHNLALSSELIKRSADLLAQLFGDQSVDIIISDYSRLDDMSTHLMFHLIQYHEHYSIHWLVGLPQQYHTLPRIEVHGQGIQWLPPMQNHRNSLFTIKDTIPFEEFHITSDLNTETSNSAISLLDTSAEAGGEPNEESDDAFQDDSFWLQVDLANEDLAWDARGIHVVYPQAASSEEDEWFVLYSAACHAFQLFAFASALFFAQHAIAMGRGYLSAKRRAKLHGICAVAAHNRQFFTETDDELARYILQQLQQAIALEEDASVRCAHWYRLAVTEGRRKGRISRALSYVSDGFGEVGRGLLTRPESLLAEAWLYNIKGYCLARDHQIDAAEEAMTQSYQILEDRDFSKSGLTNEVRLTMAVTVENTMKLMRMVGNAERWQELQLSTEQLSSPWPVFNPAHLAEKADLAIHWLDLHVAIEHAKNGIQASIHQLNAPQVQYFHTMLAELYLRAQLWQHAMQEFKAALSMPHTLDANGRPSDLPIRISCVRGMLLGGYYEEAETMLAKCQQDTIPLDKQTSEQAEINVNDRLVLGCLNMEIANQLKQEERLQTLCDELTQLVKEHPDIENLASLNAYIASIAWQNDEQEAAIATAKNSWNHGRELLTNIVGDSMVPSTTLIDTILKAFLHPILLAQHKDEDWLAIFSLQAKTLRTHTISWHYLDPLIRAVELFQRQGLLKQSGHASCFDRAVASRRECQLNYKTNDTGPHGSDPSFGHNSGFRQTHEGDNRAQGQTHSYVAKKTYKDMMPI